MDITERSVKNYIELFCKHKVDNIDNFVKRLPVTSFKYDFESMNHMVKRP